MSKIIKQSSKSVQEKAKYQVTNWPAYNRALINRGDITRKLHLVQHYTLEK